MAPPSHPDRQGIVYAAMIKLIESEQVHWALLDDRGRPIFIPGTTLEFLRTIYAQAELSGLPPSLMDGLEKTLTAKSCEIAHPVPKSFSEDLPGGCLACCAIPVAGEDDSKAILLKLVSNNTTEDFSILTRGGISPREAEVISYLPLGYQNRDIAMAMDITEDGVKKHLQSIATKLDARGRTEILYKAIQKKRVLLMLDTCHDAS